jgi:peptide/nickel transport system substrate-binding protein
MGLQSHFQWFTQLDEKLNIQPDIAKSWTILLMQNLYFTLRKDIYFQKHILFGKDIQNCKCIWFWIQLNRLLDEKVASPGGWVLQNVESQSQNDSIFEIKLIKPFLLSLV